VVDDVRAQLDDVAVVESDRAQGDAEVGECLLDLGGEVTRPVWPRRSDPYCPATNTRPAVDGTMAVWLSPKATECAAGWG
jgi:hypothetical protein